MPETRDLRERIRDGTNQEVLSQVKVLERLTRGDIGGEGRANGVVGEREEDERGKAAKEDGEGTGELKGGEVDGGDTKSDVVAADAGPVARGGVALIPVGKGVSRVGEAALDLLQKKAILA